jgi:hypothetical protein
MSLDSGPRPTKQLNPHEYITLYSNQPVVVAAETQIG